MQAKPTAIQSERYVSPNFKGVLNIRVKLFTNQMEVQSYWQRNWNLERT